MISFLSIIVFLLLGVLIFRLRFFIKTNINRFILLSLFTLKAVAGIGLISYYNEIPDGKKYNDVFKYFYDGHELSKVVKKKPSVFLKLLVGIQSPEEEATYLEGLTNWKTHTKEYMKAMNYKESNLLNSQRFMIRINALISLFSRGEIVVHSLIFCFLSFIGLISIVNNFPEMGVKAKSILLIAISCIPSSILFSSTILKESVVFFSLFLSISFFFSHKKKLLASLPLLVLLFTSVHLFALLIISFITTELFLHRKKWLYFLSFSTLICFLCLYYYKYNPLLEMIVAKQNQQTRIGEGGHYFSALNGNQTLYVSEENFDAFPIMEHEDKDNYSGCFKLPKGLLAQTTLQGKKIDAPFQLVKSNWHYRQLSYSKSASYIPTPELKPTLLSFMSFFPIAITNCLTHPRLSFENWMKNLPFFIENIILLLSITAILFLRKEIFIQTVQSQKIIIALIIFSVTALFLFAYTNPIIGNLVRYKSSCVVGLFIVSFILVTTKLKNRKRNNIS